VLNETTGRYQEAAEAFEKRLSFLGRDEDATGLSDASDKSSKQSYWRWVLDYQKESAKRETVSPTTFARIYAQLGDKGQAFEWLEKAYEEREGLIIVKVDPQLDPLRDDPRFQDLLLRMNLEP